MAGILPGFELIRNLRADQAAACFAAKTIPPLPVYSRDKRNSSNVPVSSTTSEIGCYFEDARSDRTSLHSEIAGLQVLEAVPFWRRRDSAGLSNVSEALEEEPENTE
jgi:hypothetical protein